MRGEYVITIHKGGDEDDEEIIVPNTLVQEGQEKLWHALFNNDDLTDVFFEFGAFAEVPVYTTLHAAQYVSEPTIGIGAYSRQVQNPTGWTIVAVNNEVYAESPSQVFTATGADFDKPIDRFFMVLVIEEPAATTNRYLASYSSALAAPVTVLDTQSYTVKYRAYFK